MTPQAARAELASAIGAGDDYNSPPGKMVYGNGSDLRGVGRGQVAWNFRVVCYVGYHTDSAANVDELAALTLATLSTIRALAGWTVDSISPDLVRQIAGGEHLTADIAVSRMIEL